MTERVMRVAAAGPAAVIVRAMPMRNAPATVVVLLAAVLAAGCTRTPATPPPAATGDRVAQVARAMIGVPYRFGGSTPRGFDCSGLAQYAYARAGLAIPRTSTAQFEAARSVRRRDLAVGDLLFFDTEWRRGHVGIYIGDGRFVHAPSSGGRVTAETLEAGYYRDRLQRIGRF